MNAACHWITTAPAKINWTLEVLGKRAAGYHEIRSVMQTLSLADDLRMWGAPSPSLEIDGPEAHGLRVADNLVLRAAEGFGAQGTKCAFAFQLTKRIPQAAGLGGGSSDAAAALRLLSRATALEPPRNTHALAASLGSDVAFFLQGGTALAAGRGEQLTALPPSPPVSLVLVTPPIQIERKTARMYAALTPATFSDGSGSEQLASKLRAGSAPDEGDFSNVFDAVADRIFPGLAQYRALLAEITGRTALLAGAGPSLFALMPDHASATRAAALIKARGRISAWVVTTTA